jgi:hypothetical protein
MADMLAPKKTETVEVKETPIKVEPFNNRCPAHWNITATDKGIEAHNGVSQETFTGTMKEFNAKLRG